MKELWEQAAETYEYNIMDMHGTYIGSANDLAVAEKIKSDYEAHTDTEAYVLVNSIDYTGGYHPRNI